MLRDIITDTIAPQPDMDIVGKGRTEIDLLDAAEQTNADIVITVRNAATKGKDYDDLLYRHGHIKVLDRPRLQARACECYAVVRKEYDRLLPPTTAT